MDREEMMMSTITSQGDALGYLSAAKSKLGGPSLLSKLRVVVEAIGEGFDAASHYQTLTARGMPHEEAARRVFATHFETR
jgi:hypothetical protein